MKYFSAILFALLALTAAGQITAPGASATRTTAYPGGYLPNDPVFIFCSDGTTTGSLTAASPGGTAPFTFEWKKWSTSTNDFTVPVKTDVNVTTSTAASLAEGGYKVRITDGGGYDNSLIAWVHLAKPTAQASLLDRRCDWVALSGVAAADTFYYYQPVSAVPTRLPASRTFLWSSNPTSVIPFPSVLLNPVTGIPPLEDVTYKLTVTDNFGCVSESSFFYESIHVNADFSVDPADGEAPLEVVFTDKSVRANTYLWKFGDGAMSTKAADTVHHIYYKPGTYSVTLIIESDLTCADSLTLNMAVKVQPSSLGIPNVFTPDGDGLNDVFLPDITSLRFIDVQIFTRSGRIVYSYRGEGMSLRDWQGWDGNVNNSSAKASPGVYFYVIRAKGWDDKDYGTKEHRGFLYLYR